MITIKNISEIKRILDKITFYDFQTTWLKICHEPFIMQEFIDFCKNRMEYISSDRSDATLKHKFKEELLRRIQERVSIS